MRGWVEWYEGWDKRFWARLTPAGREVLRATDNLFELDEAFPIGSPAMTKRELIDTGTDKRYARRDKDGKFKESVDVSRSLSPDASRCQA